MTSPDYSEEVKAAEKYVKVLYEYADQQRRQGREHWWSRLAVWR